MHTHLWAKVPSWRIKCIKRGAVFSLCIPPHLFKVFIYLSHYSAPVASLTLQRNSYVVYLSRSDASPSTFTFLFPGSHSLRTKTVLISLRFSIPFVFFPPIGFYSFINSPQSWQLKLCAYVAFIFHPRGSSILPLGSSKLTTLLSQLWTSPVEAG